MPDLDAVLEANHAAVADLISAAEQSGDRWTTPRAPGKWSPSQVVEHVARALEESAHMVAGRPAKFPGLPAIVRPVVRMLLFNRVLRTGAFPKARTSAAMNPATGPASPAEGRTRLETALAQFERECVESARVDPTCRSRTFGRVSIADFARFQEIHTRHHLEQMH